MNCNSIFFMIFNHCIIKNDYLIFRYDLTDPRMVRLFTLINSTTSLGVAQKLLMTFPFLRFIAPKMTGWTEQKEVNDTITAGFEY